MRPSCSPARSSPAPTCATSTCPWAPALRAHHPGQRPRPHQADHARPPVAGEHRRRHRPGREGGRGRRHRRRRRHRQAVHLRGRRRPQGRRAAEAARGRAGHRQGRPRRLQAPGEAGRADLRVLQRRRDGRRRGDRPALLLPDGVRGPPRLLLPEVFLGLVPGWGGCTLLPNLIGADKAVSVIIENSLNQNKQLKGAQVYELGIADAIFEGADFLEQSLIWTASVLKGEIAVERPAIDRGEAWDQAVAKGRFIADSKVHGAAPAAYRALDIIAAAKNGDLQQGYDARTRPSPT